MPQPELNIWQLLGMQQNQQNPAVMSQMVGQASQGPMSTGEPPAPVQPPPPQVVQLPPEKVPMTAQPTTSPIGTLPQEMPAVQPALTDPNSKGTVDWLREYMLSQKPTMSPEMERQMRIADQNAAESIGRQDQALDMQKQLAAHYAKQDQGLDYRPLAAYVDSMTGSKLSGAAESMAPDSPQKKLQNQLDMATKIATTQGGITKDQLDYIRQKLQQQSYVENRASKADIARNADLTKLATSGATSGLQRERLDLQKQRLGYQTDKEARAAVNNDQMLKLYTPRLEGAAKIGELIQSAREGKVVKNNALLGQLNAEIARLETGSQSPGLAASEKTELTSAQAELQAFYDRVKSSPSDSLTPEILDTADKLISELSSSYKKGIDSRMKVLKGGMTDNQKAIVDEKHKAIKDTYAPRLGGWEGIGEAAGAPKVGDIMDGHKFKGGDPGNPASWELVN